MEPLLALAPILCTALGAIAVMMLNAFTKRSEDMDLAQFYVAIGAILLALFSCVYFIGFDAQRVTEVSDSVAGTLLPDPFGGFLGVVLCLAGMFTVLMSVGASRRLPYELGDYLALLLLAMSGMLTLVFANELITIFAGIELMSIPIYILVGINKHSHRSNEASLKYLVLGGFASSFLLFGLAMLYAVGSASHGSGTTVLTDFDALTVGDKSDLPLVILGLGLTVIGFCFKVGAVPFHQWVPDVYEGAPTPITGFMATAVKAAGFGVFLRILLTVFPVAEFNGYFGSILWIVCAASILLGNLIAIAQTNIKRMLAYSSIAHAGYILLGVIATAGGTQSDGSAILFYLVAYMFMNLGAFAIVQMASDDRQNLENIDDLTGLARKRPVAGLALAISMLSLAGIPLTGGFWGKVLIFSSALENGYLSLVLIAILGSLIGAFYYLRVVWTIYMKPAEREFPTDRNRWGLTFVMALTAIGTMAIGVSPQTFMDWAQSAVMTLR